MATWRPRLSEPGEVLWNCRKRYILVHGPRKGGKSLAIADKLIRNALNYPGSNTCILTRTIAKGEAGVWRNITKPGGMLSKWQKAGLAKYHSRKGKKSGPSYRPSSKVPFFELSTAGDPSTFEMHTLAEDEKVEDKFKDQLYDFIYLVEADSFERDVYTTMRMCLRSTVVPYHAQQLILDMNPPAEGKKHWAYKFIESPGDDEIAIQFPIEKNCFLQPSEREDIRSTYAHDPNKLKRFFHGEWVEMAEGSCFSDVFNENLHVVGEDLGSDAEYDVLDQMSILRPWEGAYQYDLGWDIGDQNTSVVLTSPRQQGNVLCYDILDEVLLLRTPATMNEFVGMVMKMQNYWTAWMKAENQIHQPMYRHWSDSSSMNKRMVLSGSEAKLVYDLSGGTISLCGVTKGRDSVEQRKNMLRRLLYENKIAVSSRCTGIISMLKHLPPKKSKVLRDDLSGKDVFVQAGVDGDSRWKHPFDALTYSLAQCFPMHLTEGAGPQEESRSLTMKL